jgi:molybdopterin molybdotransferase
MNTAFVSPPQSLTVDEAIVALIERTQPRVDVETVPLSRLLGRVLAEDVISPLSLPPHDNSAVDGYAVFFDDLTLGKETRLPVTARIAAGHPLGRPAKRGEALRIFTGAQAPEGPDTIIMQEDCSEEGEAVRLPAKVKRGTHRRLKGEDVAAGQVVLTQGTLCRPSEVAMAAAIGQVELKVYRQLKAAIFSTGDEIAEPGTDLPPGAIYDCNRFSVAALLKSLGASVTDLGILPDRREMIREALELAGPGHDIIITSGGVSEGEEDHVKQAVQDIGELHFWRLKIKPGRPVALGEAAGVPFIGLPGNPVAAMIIFMILGRPLAMRLAGIKEVNPLRFAVPAAFSFRRQPGRREFLRGRLAVGEDGVLRVEKFPSEGSGIVSSMVYANALIDLPEELAEIAPGEMVRVLPFSEVLR